jgi:hypothetical protein
MLERCVLFLDGRLEFDLPVPTLGLANILSNQDLPAVVRSGNCAFFKHWISLGPGSGIPGASNAPFLLSSGTHATGINI